MLNICKHIGRSFHDEGILYINWKKKDGLTQKNEKTKKQTPDINKIWIEQNCPLGCEHAWWSLKIILQMRVAWSKYEVINKECNFQYSCI